MAESSESKNNRFKDTLNLPQTLFPIRAQSAIDDPKMLERWQAQNLYKQAFEHNKGKEKFIFHDGPPYANGHIHLGSAYNKILKDIICKARRMQGYHVPVTPGWDCHGLPIELNVTREHPNLTSTALKKECRAYANQWIAIQKEEFKSLGAVMNWDEPYLTMSPEYEADTLKAFGIFVQEGYIEKKNKTVPWCPSCQTVLATAEIEYKERKDPSAYVLFKVEHNALPDAVSKDHAYIAVWTTTPWTLPLNRAILLKKNSSYAVVKHDNKYLIVGASQAANVCQKANIPCEIVATISAQDLAQGKAHNPLVEGLKVPFILDDGVSAEDGTVAVHCAPGCGPEDYEIGIQHGLEIYSPINPDGTYSANIAPTELTGMSSQWARLGYYKNYSIPGFLLLHKESIERLIYPHCWRLQKWSLFLEQQNNGFLNL